jgi:hypothetical protein
LTQSQTVTLTVVNENGFENAGSFELARNRIEDTPRWREDTAARSPFCGIPTVGAWRQVAGKSLTVSKALQQTVM